MITEACLALAIYWEARNQPILGQKAVAEVVINRANSPKFPKDICAVVQTCDFSWYCDGKSDKPKEPKAWYRAFTIAKAALGSMNKRILPKNTYYFHNTTVSPPFFKKKHFVTQIGDHKFYKESPH
jgi:N-acetylmuramoyl-L-alanine amidase